MKRNSLLAAMILMCSLYSFAQYGESDLKPFKVDVSAGYAVVSGKGSKGGVLFVVEPKYAVNSMISVGLRIEAAVVARFSGYDQNGNVESASVKASGSYLATADYYFKEDYSFRPFAGAGLGIFTMGTAEINSTADGIATGSKFGGMLRVGAEVSHFRFGVEYNIIPSTTFEGTDNNGDPAKLTSKNSYIGVKIGVCFGGGPR